MQRRQFMAAGAAAAAPAPERRNAILIYCEQFQHNVASFVGGPARTPALEKLAEQAVVFRTACTTTGLCSPSRAALFTGRLGHRTGLDDNCNVWHSRLTRLDAGQPTLIEWARRKNYLIGYFGKWHLGRDGPILRGAHRYPATGFDRVQSPPGKADRKPDFAANRAYYQPGASFAEKPGFYATAPGGYEKNEAARLAAQAAEFLREARDTGKPFFLTVSFNAVHPPYHVPQPYSSMYHPRALELPASLRDTFAGKPAYQSDVMWPFHDTGHMSENDWRRAVAYYHGFVTMLDRALGEIDGALHAHGLAESTMLVIVADHGDMVGAHNRFDKGPYCYDEIMRIPLLIRAPGIAPRQVRRHVSSIDLNRTLGEWMRLEPDVPNVDSRSLLPLMERGDSGWNHPDEAYYRYEWYNGLWFGIRAIRTPRYKYCFNPCGVDEFYDLEADPAEMNNLALKKPSPPPAMRPLQERLLAHLAETHDTMLHAKLREYLSLKRTGALLLLSFWPAAGAAITETSRSPYAVVRGAGISDVRWTGGFWAERFALARDVVMPEMWRTLQIVGNGACYRNLLIAAGRDRGDFRGNNWSDGDVYKWLEGAALIYEVTRDPALDRLMDDVIDTIGKAQQPDGYISTQITVPNKQRWQAPRDHEMYNMGHLMTAACIHHRATGKRSLLEIARKCADYLYPLFQPRPARLAHFSVPSNIMGVVELYRETRDPRYLDLAQTFVDMRGAVPGGTDHFQTRVPLRKETQAVGHAVHATYFYATAADLVSETGEKELRDALERIWLDVTTRKMYVTGSVGPFTPGLSPRGDVVGEAFGAAYDLPNQGGYNETCANIGNALWNYRMLTLTGDARFADVMELVFYNSMLSGLGLNGKEFFYSNIHRRFDTARRFAYNDNLQRWSNTTQPGAANSYCCPPNLLRVLAGLHGYAYGLSDGAVWVHLYGSSTFSSPLLKLNQKTDYPWDGRVTLTAAADSAGEVEVRLRIPGWSAKTRLRVNGAAVPVPAPAPGTYHPIRRRWKSGDTVELTLDVEARLIEANPRVEQLRSHVAVVRGPVVYCLESPDLPKDVQVPEVRLPAGVRLTPRWDRTLLGGVTVLEGRGRARNQGDWSGLLYRPLGAQPARDIAIRLIPYYAWANRGLSMMTVWLPLAE
jgi:hypothetical protein